MHKKELGKFTRRSDEKIRDILPSINVLGLAFVVDQHDVLLGVITDGDIRRAAIKGYSLDATVSEVMNRECFYAFEESSDDEILSRLPKTVSCIPLVNKVGRLVGYKKYTDLASRKSALITGITGQDGAYLANFLLKKGYTVYGGYRRTSQLNFSRLEYLGIQDQVKLIPLDVIDTCSVVHALQTAAPDEVYNLAAQSFVETSFNQPHLTLNVNALGVTNFLTAIRDTTPTTKFYQASTSELYGKVREIPQNENTPFYPRSPYAVSKLAAYWMTNHYREAYGLFACNGILFNHESPLRGPEFVTRKISLGVARISLGLSKTLSLGNLEAKRDWGYAPDYVQCMWLMMQQPTPEDFVIATGKTTTVREFAERAFKVVGLDYKDYVRVDPKYFRPTEVDILMGDSTKAREKLKCNPGATSLQEIIETMVKSDLNLLEQKKASQHERISSCE